MVPTVTTAGAVVNVNLAAHDRLQAEHDLRCHHDGSTPAQGMAPCVCRPLTTMRYVSPAAMSLSAGKVIEQPRAV